MIALAEVGTEAILDAIRSLLIGDFVYLWEPPGLSTQTGIGVLARMPPCAHLELVDTQRPTIASRPRIMLARVTLAAIAEPFLLAVEDRTTTAVIVGDFNAEPYEAPFKEVGLRSRRHFSSALWSRATPAYLYNTAWRSMTEPRLWEETNVSGYEEPRPKTSHDDSPGVIYDQLLVSGRALRNGPITLRECTVEYHWNTVIAIRKSTGVLRPHRWSYTDAVTFAGASDHFPLLATFAY